MTTTTRREITHRITALALSVVTTLSILGSVNLLAVEPAPNSLLAQQQAPAVIADVPASASPRS